MPHDRVLDVQGEGLYGPGACKRCPDSAREEDTEMVGGRNLQLYISKLERVGVDKWVWGFVFV